MDLGFPESPKTSLQRANSRTSDGVSLLLLLCAEGLKQVYISRLRHNRIEIHDHTTSSAAMSLRSRRLPKPISGNIRDNPDIVNNIWYVFFKVHVGKHRGLFRYPSQISSQTDEKKGRNQEKSACRIVSSWTNLRKIAFSVGVSLSSANKQYYEMTGHSLPPNQISTVTTLTR